jgi:hypothetical protein
MAQNEAVVCDELSRVSLSLSVKREKLQITFD